MSGYLGMECINCGRHRVEENGICEKCGYDNDKKEYASEEEEIMDTGKMVGVEGMRILIRMGRLMNELIGYLPFHLASTAMELGDRAGMEAKKIDPENLENCEMMPREDLMRVMAALHGMESALARMRRAAEARMKELGG